MASCITSLRGISTYDWRAFFESVSGVEQILRSDPAGVYAHMDRATCDQYRKTVESMALAGRQGEWDVAAAAVQLAQEHAPPRDTVADAAPPDDTHEDGAQHLPQRRPSSRALCLARPMSATICRAVAAPSLRRGWAIAPLRCLYACVRWMDVHPTPVYLGPILLLTLILLAAAPFYAMRQGGSRPCR